MGAPAESVAVVAREPGAVYEARDGVEDGGGRLHLCAFDATGRLVALTHPGA